MGKAEFSNKIRYLRFHANEMTQQELADKVECTRQTIVALEQGKYVPSLSLAFKIAKAFNVGVAHFFQDEVKSDKIAITRRTERVRVERRPHHRKSEVNYVYEALDTKKVNKQMEPFMVEFPVQDTSEMVFMNHDGEEFLHVLQGTLEFRSVDRVEVLKEGDSIYFESDLSHSFRCLGQEPAKAIVVVWNG